MVSFGGPFVLGKTDKNSSPQDNFRQVTACYLFAHLLLFPVSMVEKWNSPAGCNTQKNICSHCIHYRPQKKSHFLLLYTKKMEAQLTACCATISSQRDTHYQKSILKLTHFPGRHELMLHGCSCTDTPYLQCKMLSIVPGSIIHYAVVLSKNQGVNSFE